MCGNSLPRRTAGSCIGRGMAIVRRRKSDTPGDGDGRRKITGRRGMSEMGEGARQPLRYRNYYQGAAGLRGALLQTVRSGVRQQALVEPDVALRRQVPAEIARH